MNDLCKVLSDHWLTSVNCSHQRLIDPTPHDKRGTNYATCSCSLWRGPERNSVGEAIQDWAEHVSSAYLASLPTGEDCAALIAQVKELDAKATKGKWGVEDPMGPETLSIVANPDAPSYEWVIVASVHSDDEDDEGGPRPIRKLEMERNAAFIAAARELLPKAASLLESQSAELARMREGGWQDIATAPKDETEILACWDKSRTCRIISWYADAWRTDDDIALNPPTHWQSLPDPPPHLVETKD